MEQGIKELDGKLPIFTMIYTQFPDAIKAVTRRTQEGHFKYIEGDSDWRNFSRVPDADLNYSNSVMRHLLEDGPETKEEHYAATAWNALARLQCLLESNSNTKSTYDSLEESKLKFIEENRDLDLIQVTSVTNCKDFEDLYKTTKDILNKK